ncbi:MAG: glutaredoxin family protein [Gammaproteobacteria bacterium]|nr:glutaredoxin family protein [Gammaproteobacteria bacterium]
MTNLPKLTLYGHSYCHLCREMYAELEKYQERRRLEIELVDIEGNDELEAEFGELVPVLKMGDLKICHYFLDEAALDAALDRHR